MINISFIKEENKAIAYDKNIEVGECKFVDSENIWNIIHTEVDSDHQGMGIARKLVEKVLEAAKKNNKNVIAECSYAKKIIEDNVAK